MLELLLMHVAVFSTLGHPWLASIRNSRRGRPETATRGSLLPRAILLLPHARRWEALGAVIPLLLPRARRWKALVAAVLLLLLHPMTPLKMWEVPPPPPIHLEEASSSSSSYNDECPHVKEVNSYELFLDFSCLV
jgi:hypothetical protein